MHARHMHGSLLFKKVRTETSSSASSDLSCRVRVRLGEYYICGVLNPVSIQTQSLALRLLRENFTQQTQAPANRNARSKQWQPWLAACQRKRLRFLRFSFTQHTQRNRLRLNGNRALANLSDAERVAGEYKSCEGTDGGEHWHERVKRQTHRL